MLHILSLTLLLTFASIATAGDYPIREAVAFTPRDGLPNFFDKLECSNDVTITEDERSGHYVNLSEQEDALIYHLRGPDSTWLEVTVDGESTKRLNLDKYCSYHRLSLLRVASQLDNKEHEVAIRALADPVDKQNILSERNVDDFHANPEKYADSYGYPGAILIL